MNIIIKSLIIKSILHNHLSSLQLEETRKKKGNRYSMKKKKEANIVGQKAHFNIISIIFSFVHGSASNTLFQGHVCLSVCLYSLSTRIKFQPLSLSSFQFFEHKIFYFSPLSYPKPSAGIVPSSISRIVCSRKRNACEKPFETSSHPFVIHALGW